MARYDGRIEPVEFSNGPVRLAGILVEPKEGVGPFPAVVFVHGSGPSTYDRPAWKAHANVLTSRGFAVLVYDKRGSAHSTGNLATSDYEDLAQDVISAVRYLRQRRDILPEKIGLFGRSEGGWVGPLAASELGNIAFVIMSSGAAVTPYEETLYAVAAELRDGGAPGPVIARALDVRKRVWDYYRKAAKDPRLASGAARDSLNAALASFAKYKLDEMPAAVAPYDSAVYSASARMRFYDPLPALTRLNAPLLAVLGENDKSVEPRTTIAALEKLKRDEHKDITIKVYSGTDHTLISRKQIPPGYVRGYLEFAADWAAAHVR
ncbi:MAG: alpha/beta hydrolase [Gemmatimonadota bacterium]|nr:alpha/beta hydrolase [Gemmatimonadota bacterium]